MGDCDYYLKANAVLIAGAGCTEEFKGSGVLGPPMGQEGRRPFYRSKTTKIHVGGKVWKKNLESEQTGGCGDWQLAICKTRRKKKSD